MMTGLAEQYYRIALSKAEHRDLSGAAQLAGYACLLDNNNKNAARLLELCQYELGDSDAEFADEINQIRYMVERKQLRQAARRAKAIPHRSVRVLNIQGCLYACDKRYGKAARAFAQALEKDCGNHFATASLAEVTKRRKG